MNVNIGAFVGAYATAANLLDEVATVPGAKGIMLIFDDFLAGLDTFGQKTQPLMSCRAIGLRRPEAPRAITRPGSCGRAKAALVSWIRTSPGCDLIGAHGRDRRLDGDGRRFDPTAAADHPGCSPPRGLPISRG